MGRPRTGHRSPAYIPPELQDVPERLRQALTSRRLTPEAVCLLATTNINTLTSIRRGLRPPRRVTLRRIKAALDGTAPVHVGLKIRAARLRAGKTQGQIAWLLGLNTPRPLDIALRQCREQKGAP
jgi:hypothetical protein